MPVSLITIVLLSTLTSRFVPSSVGPVTTIVLPVDLTLLALIVTTLAFIFAESSLSAFSRALRSDSTTVSTLVSRVEIALSLAFFSAAISLVILVPSAISAFSLVELSRATTSLILFNNDASAFSLAVASAATSFVILVNNSCSTSSARAFSTATTLSVYVLAAGKIAAIFSLIVASAVSLAMVSFLTFWSRTLIRPLIASSATV